MKRASIIHGHEDHAKIYLMIRLNASGCSRTCCRRNDELRQQAESAQQQAEKQRPDAGSGPKTQSDVSMSSSACLIRPRRNTTS